jgi:hypothetical protein
MKNALLTAYRCLVETIEKTKRKLNNFFYIVHLVKNLDAVLGNIESRTETKIVMLKGLLIDRIGELEEGSMDADDVEQIILDHDYADEIEEVIERYDFSDIIGNEASIALRNVKELRERLETLEKSIKDEVDRQIRSSLQIFVQAIEQDRQGGNQ